MWILYYDHLSASESACNIIMHFSFFFQLHYDLSESSFKINFVTRFTFAIAKRMSFTPNILLKALCSMLNALNAQWINICTICDNRMQEPIGRHTLIGVYQLCTFRYSKRIQFFLSIRFFLFVGNSMRYISVRLPWEIRLFTMHSLPTCQCLRRCLIETFSKRNTKNVPVVTGNRWIEQKAELFPFGSLNFHFVHTKHFPVIQTRGGGGEKNRVFRSFLVVVLIFQNLFSIGSYLQYFFVFVLFFTVFSFDSLSTNWGVWSNWYY